METGICRRCGCTWTTPCLDEVCGACWWMDKNRTLCSHCFYGFNDEPYHTKVYYRPGHDFIERDAVRFIAREFYGLDRIYRDEIPKWQEIIANNMIFHNAAVNESEHYASCLPRKYRTED